MPRVLLTPEAFMHRRGGVRRVAQELCAVLSARSELEVWSPQHRVDPEATARAGLRRRIPAHVDLLRETIGSRHSLAVVHALYYDAIPVPGAPRVVTVYDLIHERFGHASRGHSLLKALSVRTADRVVAISASTADDIAHLYGLNRDTIDVIHLGVSDCFRTAPASTPVGLDRPYLIYVGNRHGYKDFRTLACAMRHPSMRRFDLVVVGGEALSDSHRLFDHQDPTSRLTWLPEASDANLTSLYDGADALVVTSRYEGFGLPVLEAMCRGCPVVATGNGALAEISGAHAQQFRAGDVLDCIRAIHTASELDESDRDALRTYGRQFSWASTADGYSRVYLDAVSQHQASGRS